MEEQHDPGTDLKFVILEWRKESRSERGNGLPKASEEAAPRGASSYLFRSLCIFSPSFTRAIDIV